MKVGSSIINEGGVDESHSRKKEDQFKVDVTQSNDWSREISFASIFGSENENGEEVKKRV